MLSSRCLQILQDFSQVKFILFCPAARPLVESAFLHLETNGSPLSLFGAGKIGRNPDQVSLSQSRVDILSPASPRIDMSFFHMS